MVETYIISWNREDTIKFTIEYYKKLGRVILYDNYSDDRTREIALECGAEIQLFGNKGELNDQHYLDVKNNCWKGSQADWVIVVDDDEILWHPNLWYILCETTFSNGLINNIPTIFKPKGFNIHSDSMPKESWLEIMTGEPNDNYSKLCCFDPKQIKEIRYNYGCHAARPIGNVNIYNDDNLYLLHYRDIGGVERLINRHKQYESRLSEVNRRYNLGHHYTESEESKRKQWKEFSERCVTLSVDGIM